MSGAGAGAGGSGLSATRDSVVSTMPETEAAFFRALRVTLAGSTMPAAVMKEELDEQMQKTAAAFAADMLLLKFVQGLPVVGLLGGAANPVYYRKVMRYVELKYRKRYLWQLLKRERQG